MYMIFWNLCPCWNEGTEEKKPKDTLKNGSYNQREMFILTLTNLMSQQLS